MGEVKVLPLCEITLDPECQGRRYLDKDAIQDYAEGYRQGKKFPPMKATYDGEMSTYLYSGFHRYQACQLAGIEEHEVEVEIVEPTEEGNALERAIFLSLSENAVHGVRRTNDDKRLVVRRALQHPRCQGWSNVLIADYCGVDEKLVRTMRKNFGLAEVDTPRIGKDGKTRSMPQATSPEPLSEAEKERLAELEAVIEGHPTGKIIHPVGLGKQEPTRHLPEWLPDELERKERILRGEAVVANQKRDHHLLQWATENGKLVPIDRGTKWGNQFLTPEDGTRDEVCDAYAQDYLPHKPSLLKDLPKLAGKVLACWCYPERCHGDTLLKLMKPEPLPSGTFRVLYADPPWGGMSIFELCSLPVKGLAEENAVLFLWVTSPILMEAFQVVRAWGFKYKTSFVWDKIQPDMEAGGEHYNSVRHELLLVCVRGSCQPDERKLFDSVQSIERTEHSVKPEEFREIIQTLYPYGKRVELFARRPIEGWETWGNEVPGPLAPAGSSLPASDPDPVPTDTSVGTDPDQLTLPDQPSPEPQMCTDTSVHIAPTLPLSDPAARTCVHCNAPLPEGRKYRCPECQEVSA